MWKLFDLVESIHRDPIVLRLTEDRTAILTIRRYDQNRRARKMSGQRGCVRSACSFFRVAARLRAAPRAGVDPSRIGRRRCNIPPLSPMSDAASVIATPKGCSLHVGLIATW